MLTIQEVFNQSVLGVYVQGEQSSAAGTCRYRGPRGLKCAVGHLVDDKYYDPAMDGPGAARWSNYVVPALRASGVDTNEQTPTGLLIRLQTAHDLVAAPAGREFREEFVEAAALVARQYGLTMPDLPQI